MRYDFTPLFRSAIGFDRISRAVDLARRLDETGSSYPPYNIEKLDDDDYRITMAVAGFSEADLDIATQESVLTVRGKAAADTNRATGGSASGSKEHDGRFLHRGIAGRAFERRFQLADTIQVTGAHLEHGLLHIDLHHEVPEWLKPRTIPVRTGGSVADQAVQAA